MYFTQINNKNGSAPWKFDRSKLFSFEFEAFSENETNRHKLGRKRDGKGRDIKTVQMSEGEQI